MSKRKASSTPPGAKRQNVKEKIAELLSQTPSITSGEVARTAGVTRQAAHYHLSRLVESGELRLLGQGRGAKYERIAQFDRRYGLEGLEEDHVWQELVDSMPEMLRTDQVRSVLGYAVTEMVNNAIDHSGGNQVRVAAWFSDGRFFVEIVDDGQGAFRKLQRDLGLPDPFASIQELAKGKTTTDPQKHTGEGIFFTSKLVDQFAIHSTGLRWMVDNERNDQAIGESSVHRGTKVRLEVRESIKRTPAEVFDAYSDKESYEFKKSGLTLKLFEQGNRFVSRSEAKRLAARLEQFSEVILDFSGVDEIGQGFVDELLRVWASQHPQTKLIPINVSPILDRMIQRGIRPKGPPQD